MLRRHPAQPGRRRRRRGAGGAPAADGLAAAVGITVKHPLGLLAVWIDVDAARPFSAEDRALLALLCGYLGQALHRVHQTDQQRETALALQRAILGPAWLPAGFAARYEPPTARSRSAVTGTTSSSCPTGGSGSWSATASGTAWTPRP